MDLLFNIQDMKKRGFDDVSIQAAEAHNAMIERFYQSPLAPHLRDSEHRDIVRASGGSLLNSAAIHEEICERVPGTILFPYGYLPIWSSIGGNVVVYALHDETFSWVDHCSFDDDETITLPKTYEMIPFSQDGIQKALIPVSHDPAEKFLLDLQSDRYTALLDELD